MKNIKILSIIFALALGFVSCELPDNVDPKSATLVPTETLFTNAQLALVNHVNNTSVNSNISRLLVQHWQEATYFTESRYNFLGRGIPDNYSSALYKDVLRDFKEAKALYAAEELSGVPAQERDNKTFIIDILEVYAYQCIVDAFGNVPYSEALLGAENSTPVYDDAASIYADLVARLNKDIASLDEGAASFGDEDLLYGGDIASWKRFASSLLLRVGMRLSDASSSLAKSTVETAAGNVFTDQSQSGVLEYLGIDPHVNSIYNAFIVGGRKDFLPTNTFIDKLVGLEDPRLAMFFAGGAPYTGAVAGLDAAQTYDNFTHFADVFFTPDLEAVLIDYVEVEFLLAEAVERGYNVGGTAEEHYNNAVGGSILAWGGTADEVSTYLARTDVAYTTATGTYNQKIGDQKWIALYNRSVEAWAEWRRLDFPILNIPEGMVYSNIPVRMPYPFDEEELNGTSYAAAVSAMGGDTPEIKLFWDKN